MRGDETLWLQNQLCFALYAATNAITRNYRCVLAPLSLTYPQYLVLVRLMETPSMTSGELARALRLDAGTLTPMLKRLAAAGLIERRRRIEDERVIDNQITPTALALRNEMIEAQRYIIERTGMAEEEIASLRENLHKLIIALGAPAEEVAEPA